MDSACQSWQACSKKPLIMGISQSSQAVYFNISPAALLIFFLAAQALFFLLYFKPVTPCPVCSSSENSPSRQVFCSWRFTSSLAFFSPGFKQTQSLQSCFPATLFDRASRVFQAPDTFPSWCCDTGTWEINDSAEGGRGRTWSCNPIFPERGIKAEN